MNHRHLLLPVAAGVTAAALVGSGATAAPRATTAAAKTLHGTLRLSPGKYSSGHASGSYLRMLFPDGKKRFNNPDSSAADKSVTLVRAGTSGGIVLGHYQQHPRPAFDGSGNALAAAIIKPQSFSGIRFGLSTLPTDPQSQKRVPAPSLHLSGNRLRGQFAALTVEWNKQYFNQGAPKPGDSAPAATGTYNAKTKHFVLTWRSKVSGGPFNGFTGIWHLEGRLS